MNANEEMLAGYADPDPGYPDADPDATWFEYRLCWYWFIYQNYAVPCRCAYPQEILIQFFFSEPFLNLEICPKLKLILDVDRNF